MKLTFEITEDELPIYLAETDDQLQLLDEGLLQLESEGESMELMQALFRAAHTLKGAAGMIAHKRMVSLTHALETAFDGLRKQTYTPTPDLISICFEAIDALRLLRDEVVQGVSSDIDIEEITDRFSLLVLDRPPSGKADNQGKKESPETEPELVIDLEENERLILIQADISPDSIASAARAFQIVMILLEAGDLISVEPKQQEIETAKPVSHLTARVRTEAQISEIKSELDLISELDKLTVEELSPAAVSPIKDDAEKIISAPSTERAQVVPKKTAPKSKFAADKTVRTSVERLDNLMNLVGELITDRNRLHQIRATFEANFKGNEEVDILTSTISHISRITDQLQSEVMGIRMVPIANVFNKFPRMVRDLANKLDKKVELIVEGEETELDRSLIELINDPLIHLLRNAVDHGVEQAKDRIAAGKSETARLLLSAHYEQGRIIIIVEDDGNGINPDAIKNRALEKGYITESEAAGMHDDEAINLILTSGFTTASRVSDVSGRGVGLDIVRNNVQRLNGTLMVESTKGQGTRFEVTLPLTLMIIQTLLVKVGNNRLAVPLASVMSTLSIHDDEIQTVNNNPVIVLRDKVLPLLRLEETYDFDRSETDDNVKFVVVVNVGKQQMGLLVNRLLGEEEVVVKSLGPIIGEVSGISSAAILGDGEVVLIIDVPDLFNMAGISQYSRGN